MLLLLLLVNICGFITIAYITSASIIGLISIDSYFLATYILYNHINELRLLKNSQVKNTKVQLIYSQKCIYANSEYVTSTWNRYILYTLLYIIESFINLITWWEIYYMFRIVLLLLFLPYIQNIIAKKIKIIEKICIEINLYIYKFTIFCTSSLLAQMMNMLAEEILNTKSNFHYTEFYDRLYHNNTSSITELLKMFGIVLVYKYLLENKYNYVTSFINFIFTFSIGEKYSITLLKQNISNKKKVQLDKIALNKIICDKQWDKLYRPSTLKKLSRILIFENTKIYKYFSKIFDTIISNSISWSNRFSTVYAFATLTNNVPVMLIVSLLFFLTQERIICIKNIVNVSKLAYTIRAHIYIYDQITIRTFIILVLRLIIKIICSIYFLLFTNNITVVEIFLFETLEYIVSNITLWLINQTINYIKVHMLKIYIPTLSSIQVKYCVYVISIVYLSSNAINSISTLLISVFIVNNHYFFLWYVLCGIFSGYNLWHMLILFILEHIYICYQQSLNMAPIVKTNIKEIEITNNKLNDLEIDFVMVPNDKNKTNIDNKVSVDDEFLIVDDTTEIHKQVLENTQTEINTIKYEAEMQIYNEYIKKEN
jgi:hypothetical protein